MFLGSSSEICDTLQERAWGYQKEARQRDADWVTKTFEYCRSINGNLLLSTDPLPDGSIHPEHETTLREVGRRLKV
jgi:alpha-L-fucosidase